MKIWGPFFPKLGPRNLCKNTIHNFSNLYGPKMLEKLWVSQFLLTLLMNVEIIMKYILYKILYTILKKCKFWPLLHQGRLKRIKMQEKALHFSKISSGEKPPYPHSRALLNVKKKKHYFAPPMHAFTCTSFFFRKVTL